MNQKALQPESEAEYVGVEELRDNLYKLGNTVSTLVEKSAEARDEQIEGVKRTIVGEQILGTTWQLETVVEGEGGPNMVVQVRYETNLLDMDKPYRYPILVNVGVPAAQGLPPNKGGRASIFSIAIFDKEEPSNIQTPEVTAKDGKTAAKYSNMYLLVPHAEISDGNFAGVQSCVLEVTESIKK
jgi:hypothetical protein